MSDPISRLNAALEGRYTIERELGEGGMATVYLADDLKHERKVALKVLKPELAAVVGAERFLAEIKTTANLQHPNILPLHDSGEADSFLYYVMPYIEGETLRDRLGREKQLPVEEAIRIATDVAEALHAAHEQGVIHRDVKPANILLSSGRPLVADFGIALAVSAAGGGRLTETGLSMGTPYYMSPEQASADREPSPASDVYSLGCVLYEMLIGEPPYTGGSAQAVLAKILTGEPPHPTQARPSIPQNVDAAISRSLEKLPADRFISARDLASALTDPSYRYGELAAAGAAAWRGLWNPLSVGMTAAALLLAGSLAWSSTRPVPPLAVERFSAPFEPGQEPISWAPRTYSLSSDGAKLVYRRQPGAATSLWIRQWDELTATPIRETEGAARPAVSPDGLSVAFVQDQEVRVLALAGGPVRSLGNGAWPYWGPDGFIYMMVGQGVARAPAGGGAQELLAEVAEGELLLVVYEVFDEGRRALLEVSLAAGTEIRALDLTSGEMTLVAVGTQPRLSPTGHLLYLEGSTLVAVPFDADRGEVTGGSIPVLDEVLSYSLSDDGKLFYTVAGPNSTELQLMWVTRDGAESPVEVDWSFDPSPNTGNRSWALSPDDSRIAMKILTDLGSDIWMKDVATGQLSRFTFADGEERFARWGPDGETITFLSDRSGNFDVWQRPADGTGEAELVYDAETSLAEGFWSPDGDWLFLRTTGLGGVLGGRDLYGMRPGVDDTPIPLVVTEFDEGAAAISPDGRWMAYQSNATGRREVFVRPFPEVNRSVWQVSNGGGRAALWAHSGRELFYISDSGELMVAEIDPGPPFVVGERRALFELRPSYYFANNTATWDVASDDQRFLMARTVVDTESEPRRFILINNFIEEIRQRVPN